VGLLFHPNLKGTNNKMDGAMETWKRKVAEAIDEFSEAKAKENEALSAFHNDKGVGQTGSAKLMESWLAHQQVAREKNEAVLRLIQMVPKPAE